MPPEMAPILDPLVGEPAVYVQALQLKAVGPYPLGFELPDHQDQGGLLAGANRELLPQRRHGAQMAEINTGLEREAGARSAKAHTPPDSTGCAAIFELLAYYALLLVLAIFTAAIAAYAVSALSISLDRKSETAMAGAIVLVTLIALHWHFDSTVGQRRGDALRRVAKSWAYPMTLLVGLGLGWQWRHHNDPDPTREQAQRIAASTCGQIAFCLTQAQRIAGGLDLGPYVKPKPTGPR